MPIGIRTQDLRKVFNSAPPLGAAGGMIARSNARGSKQPKLQITAARRDLPRGNARRNLLPAGPQWGGQVDHSGCLDDTSAPDQRTGMDRRTRGLEKSGRGEGADWSGTA